MELLYKPVLSSLSVVPADQAVDFASGLLKKRAQDMHAKETGRTGEKYVSEFARQDLNSITGCVPVKQSLIFCELCFVESFPAVSRVLYMAGQFLHTGIIKHVLQPEYDSLLMGMCCVSDRTEAVPAGFKEIIENADSLYPQDLSRDRAQFFLGFCLRGNIFRLCQMGSFHIREHFPVDLAAGCKRHFIKPDKEIRHHILCEFAG